MGPQQVSMDCLRIGHIEVVNCAASDNNSIYFKYTQKHRIEQRPLVGKLIVTGVNREASNQLPDEEPSLETSNSAYIVLDSKRSYVLV